MPVRIERFRAADVQGAGPTGVAARLRELIPSSASVAEAVAQIIVRVRVEGDRALEEFVRRFDTAGVDPLGLVVTPAELDQAIKRLDLQVVAGLQVAIANVAEVAQRAISDDRAVDLPQGQRVRLREVPVSAAAVYVPGGRAAYPSTVVMGVVTARAAGVLDVMVCAPPGPQGDIDPVILGTCRLCGVQTVYRMGGAHAVAALAHGTQTVRRADVIVGPGSLYVQEAKRQLSGVVGIDGFAGPSDLLVVLDPDTDVRLVALDLLAQAEHGDDSLVAALCPSAATLDALEHELQQLTDAYPDLPAAPCVLVETPETRFSLALANAFSPEHLQLIGPDAEQLAPLVQSAGCVFVGAASATAFGDYVAGSNHVLPTGGAARFSSGLSPRHFRRVMAEVHIGASAQRLAEAGAPIARAEGFPLHALSMQARATPPAPTAAGPGRPASDPPLQEN